MELKVIFLEIVYQDLYSDKVWGFSFFSFCTPPGDIYGRPLLSPLSLFLSFAEHKFFFSHSDSWNQVQIVMNNKELNSIATWMKTNKLSVKINETNNISYSNLDKRNCRVMYYSFFMMSNLSKTGKVNISTKISARNHT